MVGTKLGTVIDGRADQQNHETRRDILALVPSLFALSCPMESGSSDVVVFESSFLQ